MQSEFGGVLAFVQSKYQEAKEDSGEVVFPIERYTMSEEALENRSETIVAKTAMARPSTMPVGVYRQNVAT